MSPHDPQIIEGSVQKYIDKAFLIQTAAATVPGVRLLWRKMVTMSNNKEFVTRNKTPFSHLMCFRKDPRGDLPDPGAFRFALRAHPNTHTLTDALFRVRLHIHTSRSSQSIQTHSQCMYAPQSHVSCTFILHEAY